MEKNHTVEEQLERAQRILDAVASDTDLQAQLAKIGYGPEALATGSALYRAAVGACRGTREERADLQGVLSALSAQRKKVYDAYLDLAEVVTCVYQDDPEMLRKLGLHPEQETTPETVWQLSGGEALQEDARRSAWVNFLDHVHHLYREMMDDEEILNAVLGEEGYSRERLKSEWAAVRLLDEEQVDLERARVEAGTQEQIMQQELAHLNSWVRRFLIVAGSQLDERPNWLVPLDEEGREAA